MLRDSDEQESICTNSIKKTGVKAAGDIAKPKKKGQAPNSDALLHQSWSEPRTSLLEPQSGKIRQSKWEEAPIPHQPAAQNLKSSTSKHRHHQSPKKDLISHSIEPKPSAMKPFFEREKSDSV